MWNERSDSGLVLVDSFDVLERVNAIIKKAEARWEASDNEWIEYAIDRLSKDRFFGLIKGKQVTREEAIIWLNTHDVGDIFGWQFHSGQYWYDLRVQIQRMCIEAHSAKTYKVYLSGKQIIVN